jgi:DNA-nicking Smr family endonuclease
MKSPIYRSFQDLKELARSVKRAASAGTAKPAQNPSPEAEVLSDEEAFELSMQDVTPLGWSDVPLARQGPIEIPNPRGSEDEGLRLLVEFVEGKQPIDLRLSGEYIEGTPNPQGRHFLDRLRQGHFVVEAHLDLHGLGIAEARGRLEAFVRTCLQNGRGCVRVVHGRGHHSLEGNAVLKEHVQKWLCSRRMGRHIMAYTSARLHDGGGGAVYVLLHRRKRGEPTISQSG